MVHNGSGTTTKPMNTEASDRELLELYAGPNATYYARQFDRLSKDGLATPRLNWAALGLGPLWAAARGLWGWFWFGVVGETLGLIFVCRGLWGPRSIEEMPGVQVGVVLAGLILLIAVKMVQGLVANWAYQRRFARWRIDRNLPTGLSLHAAMAGGALMAVIYPLMVYRFSAPQVVDFIADFPTTRKIEQRTAQGIDAMVDWLTINLETIFDTITAGVRTILNFLELVFIGIPWPVMSLVLLLLAWRVAGRKVALFTAVALAYLGFFGFWEKSMSTISLVGASVCICFVFGTPLGIWCAKSTRINIITKPLLDFMQTMPSFVYLVPAIAFFSIGKPPGVLATVIFAMPPMIRLTTLGIQQVPDDVKEAAIAFGASQRQLLFKVELPLAIPAIMTGINQTIMMSLSMVVVAALIGAGGLGYDVLFALQHVEAGRGALAGIAIAFCAMILDRIVQGSRQQETQR
jgi:glycine betaine/proline transport system permease protein